MLKLLRVVHFTRNFSVLNVPMSQNHVKRNLSGFFNLYIGERTNLIQHKKKTWTLQKNLLRHP